MDDDLTVVNFSSPDHAMLSVPASSIKKDSVYDKLGELAGTIETGIRTISSDAGANVEATIQSLKRGRLSSRTSPLITLSQLNRHRVHF